MIDTLPPCLFEVREGESRTWHVLTYDMNCDGEIFAAEFSGFAAEEQARDYAAMKNGQPYSEQMQFAAIRWEKVLANRTNGYPPISDEALRRLRQRLDRRTTVV
jgi:hypothetical protein